MEFSLASQILGYPKILQFADLPHIRNHISNMPWHDKLELAKSQNPQNFLAQIAKAALIQLSFQGSRKSIWSLHLSQMNSSSNHSRAKVQPHSLTFPQDIHPSGLITKNLCSNSLHIPSNYDLETLFPRCCQIQATSFAGVQGYLLWHTQFYCTFSYSSLLQDGDTPQDTPLKAQSYNYSVPKWQASRKIPEVSK